MPAASPDIVREHVEEGASFETLGRRYGISGPAAYKRYNKAANGELDSLESHLRAGGISFDVPLDPLDEFRAHLTRLQWIIEQLYVERGVMLKVKSQNGLTAVHFRLELL